MAVLVGGVGTVARTGGFGRGVYKTARAGRNASGAPGRDEHPPGRVLVTVCAVGHSQAATFGWSTLEAPTPAAPPGEPRPETSSLK